MGGHGGRGVAGFHQGVKAVPVPKHAHLPCEAGRDGGLGHRLPGEKEHVAAFGVEPVHIHRLPQRHAQVLALADCEVVHPVVRADLFARLQQDESARPDGQAALYQKLPVAARREAELWLSGLSATGRPAPAAMARSSALSRPKRAARAGPGRTGAGG